MKARRLKAVALEATFEESAAVSPRAPASATRGEVVGWEAGRGISVRLPSGQVALAQTVVALSETELQQAVAARQAVMLTFEDGDVDRPVILGLLAPVPATRTTRALAGSPGIDDVVVIKGRSSLELRCGAASITLRQDGKVIVRGTSVISRATKENRISGGSVHFN